MKSILKKFAGITIAAIIAVGIFSCSNGNTEEPEEPVLTPEPAKKTVATPTFSEASGEVESGTTVTISCATDGAKIYYTIDKSAPTIASTEYTAAISITEDVTIMAFAVKDGMNDSEVANASYTIKVPAADYNKYEVGDFILKDGTVFPKDETPERGTVAAVIVRATANGKPALGVGIIHDRTGCRWCASSSSGFSTDIIALRGTKTDGYIDGNNSWELLVAACEDLKNATAEEFETVAENYEAFNYCRKYGSINGLEGDLAEGWYLPTVAELYTIYQSKATVNASLLKTGENQFGNGGYLSCSQGTSGIDQALILEFEHGYSGSGKKSYNYEYYLSVCAVKTFN